MILLSLLRVEELIRSGEIKWDKENPKMTSTMAYFIYIDYCRNINKNKEDNTELGILLRMKEDILSDIEILNKELEYPFRKEVPEGFPDELNKERYMHYVSYERDSLRRILSEVENDILNCNQNKSE